MRIVIGHPDDIGWDEFMSSLSDNIVKRLCPKTLRLVAGPKFWSDENGYQASLDVEFTNDSSLQIFSHDPETIIRDYIVTGIKNIKIIASEAKNRKPTFLERIALNGERVDAQPSIRTLDETPRPLDGTP